MQSNRKTYFMDAKQKEIDKKYILIYIDFKCENTDDKFESGKPGRLGKGKESGYGKGISVPEGI